METNQCPVAHQLEFRFDYRKILCFESAVQDSFKDRQKYSGYDFLFREDVWYDVEIWCNTKAARKGIRAQPDHPNYVRFFGDQRAYEREGAFIDETDWGKSTGSLKERWISACQRCYISDLESFPLEGPWGEHSLSLWPMSWRGKRLLLGFNVTPLWRNTITQRLSIQTNRGPNRE